MSDSDSESYEVIDDRLSPSVRGGSVHSKNRLMSRDQRKSSSRSPAPPVGDIDFRPPYPTPKPSSQSHRSSSLSTGSSQLTYDRITISPVVPDYETTSSSCSPPPIPYSTSQPADIPPPLPPLNSSHQKKKFNRSNSESVDNLSQTPPHSFTQTPRLNGHSSKHNRSNSNDFDSVSATNPTYNRQGSTKYRSGSVDSLPVGRSQSSSESYVRDSPVMPLASLAANYKKDLPLQVVVTKGFYGADERTSISDGDMFNIHFFKHTKVVKISDTNKYSYTIPLNSSLEFGMVYKLPPGFKQSNPKYHFKTVGEVLQLKTLPKVMRATVSYRGSGPENSVEQNDLLVLKEVKQKRGLKTSRVLKCIHPGSGMKKTLTEDCAGCFTVRPQDLRLFLPEIVEHIDLPQSAILFYGGGNKLDLPPHLISSEVKILTMEIEESIVATSILEEEEAQSLRHYENTPSIPLVDIPVDLDIEVAIIKLAEMDTDNLYSETRSLLEKYNPSLVSYLNIKSSVTASAQSTLFKAVRQDQYQQIGIEIIRPENAFKMRSEVSLNRLSNGSDSSRRQLYTPSECANAEEVHSRLELLESNSTGLENRINMFELKMQSVERERPDHEGLKKEMLATKSEVSKMRRDYDDLKKTIGDVKDHVSKFTSTMEKLARVVDNLQKEFRKSQLEKELAQKPTGSYIQMFPAGESPTSNGIAINGTAMNGGSVMNGGSAMNGGTIMNGTVPKGVVSTNGTASTPMNGSTQSPEENERINKQFLMQMDPAEVCQLLDCLKLGMYKDNFTKEQITGEILSDLNADDLRDELGVSSKIHRVKLMKIITGRHSASSVLSGEDPYYIHSVGTI